MRSGPGAARTILLLHIISVRPSKQPLMVRTFLKACMKLGSYFVSARTNKRHIKNWFTGQRFIINRVPPAVGRLHLRRPTAHGCALAHSPQTTREVRATFYSRLSQYGPHAAPCTCVGPCPHGPGGGPPALHARFPSVPTSGVRSSVTQHDNHERRVRNHN